MNDSEKIKILEEFLDKTKPREWTLCHGEYDDPAWNGPEFDGTVKVIEMSAYDDLAAQLKIATDALDEIDQDCSCQDTTAWSIAAEALEKINNG